MMLYCLAFTYFNNFTYTSNFAENHKSPKAFDLQQNLSYYPSWKLITAAMRAF